MRSLPCFHGKHTMDEKSKMLEPQHPCHSSTPHKRSLFSKNINK